MPSPRPKNLTHMSSPRPEKLFSITKSYKPKRNAGAFNYMYITYKNGVTINEYLESIKPYLRDLINYLKKSGKCKIHLAIKRNLDAKEITEELFHLFLQRY